METVLDPHFPHRFEDLVQRLLEAVRLAYGPRLLALAVFGSVGRGKMRPDSDIDFLIVAEPLPHGRMARVAEWEPIEQELSPALEEARALGVLTEWSPIFKTPAELAAGSPILFDMTEDARILWDPQGVLAEALLRMKERLARNGARRIWSGNAWYWELQPGHRPGEPIEI
ncbi:nucleotidyltransferase domain-containing protein [Methylacidimicrobium sp. B4]|uniref:nucleotidyltransferase domain-containing protein n=1 Tax=Methylacidimicrobium sp. B4 TaxID=2796139 RepID=UPI001A8EEF16|nr:nucleotidyltransferase domain-containing protein [Methylacidimicrobium sp. B4]QSR84370.1 nucleotidyltransferase domain-containing protein [Methylacidimicrobium sp. B4]